MNRIKLIIGLIIFSLMFAGVSQSQTNSPVKIKDSLEKNYLKIKEKKSQKTKMLRDISSLNKEIRYLELQKNKNKKKLKKNKGKLVKSNRAIKTLEKSLSEKTKALEERVIQLYKTKTFGFFELILLNSELPSLFESYIFKRLLESDADLVKNVRKQHDFLEAEKEKLENYTANVNKLTKSISKQEKALKRSKKRKTKTVGSLESEISKIEKKNEALRVASIAIASEVIKGTLGKTQFFGKGKFIRPVKGWLSSSFGWRKHPIYKRRILHRGVDFAAPTGHKIKAAESGIVIVAGRKKKYNGYGKITIIDHGTKAKKRYSTVYAHQSRIFVKVGDYISRGDVIGWVGSTGNSTGPHLHFEIRVNGNPVNPLKYIKL
ncbi:peptidoglycan DD-metalloendopeptidase family protein [bacterium]|jgi:murein DD-endopeptidase MepM/ murein hydrolase activator NlpD|nr:peptidoglycan DD-metalloendopeptidase family protein [bacterium]